MTVRAAVLRLLTAGSQQRPWQIVTTSASLVGSVVTTAGLGLVYWWAAALMFTQTSVGFASASVSAMMLLGTVAGVGLGTLLINEMPRHPERELGLIATALLIAATVGAVLGAAFSLISALLSPDFAPLGESPQTVGLFACGAGITAALLVMDVALIGLLRGDLQFTRNAIFALVKLVLLLGVGVIFAGRTGITIFATWVLGSAISLAVLGLYVIWKGRAGRLLPLQWAILRQVRGSALRHYALNISLQLPDWGMPILVTVVLSAATNAAFFMAWMIISVAFYVPNALSQTLYAVGSRSPETLSANLRLTLRLSFLSGVAITLAILLFGPWALGLLGHRYQEAAFGLVILAVGIFPVAIKFHYVTIGRLNGQMTSTTGLSAVGVVAEFSLAAVGGHMAGLSGVAVGILLALLFQAVLMAPRVRRALGGEPVSRGVLG
jgi:O-antigen/teichoic acid export membrane protein